MTSVFADTFYWIACIRPDDQWSEAARHAREKLDNATLATTDEVLTEFLTAVSRGGPTLRRQAVQMVRTILAAPDVTVIPQSREGFMAAVALYEMRADKGYSLADCVSMNAMRDRNLTQVLTNDRHFEQEGFIVLVER